MCQQQAGQRAAADAARAGYGGFCGCGAGSSFPICGRNFAARAAISAGSRNDAVGWHHYGGVSPVEPVREAPLRESSVPLQRSTVTSPAIEEAPKATPVFEPPPVVHHKTEIHSRCARELSTTWPPDAGPYPEDVEVAAEPGFDVNRLSAEEQELHRRANRVAKVSMQDIKMLRPEQVRLGREKKDLCLRLRDDIEKAHREYDRRFRPIMDHPVDYFYRWMVEILGGWRCPRARRVSVRGPRQPTLSRRNVVL